MKINHYIEPRCGEGWSAACPSEVQRTKEGLKNVELSSRLFVEIYLKKNHRVYPVILSKTIPYILSHGNPPGIFFGQAKKRKDKQCLQKNPGSPLSSKYLLPLFTFYY